MKLVGSKTSPYVRKARVLLAEKAIAFDFVEDNAWSAEAQVPRFNPLGKVPALVLDDGEAFFDSVAIAEYLETLGGAAFLPPPGIERARVRRDEALGDGIADAGISVFLERKREAARQDAAWIERQLGKVESGIGALAKALEGRKWLRGDAITLGDVACGCALFWVEFRLPEIGWRARHPGLRAWAERLEARPSFAGTRPGV
jgi:glutathione S-transferase